MNGASDLQIAEDVRSAFEPILAALGRVRQEMAAIKHVVALRPGFYYPPTGKPVPAVVVAVTPGTTPANAADVAQRFGVPFRLAEASPEE
jgi:hypothetical protein